MATADALRDLHGYVVNAARGFVRRRPWLKRRLLPLARPLWPWLQPRSIGADYRQWIREHDTLSDADRAAIRAHVARLPHRPLISVVMPAFETPERFLREAIASVRAQLYPHWELCVADDASPSPHVARVLEEAARADPRIRWVRRETNGHIPAATNTALALATGEWVALMDHDDLLAERALYEVAVAINTHPDAALIYSDEDKVDARGRRNGPYFKPDFDPDLLLGQNFVNHLSVLRRDLLVAIGGLREGFEGSQDHDLVLRAVAACGARRVRHIPAVLYHWRRAAGPASFSEANLARCVDAARRAVAERLAARGVRAEVTSAPLAPAYLRVVWPLPDPPPLVSAIVPTRDRADLLGRCLEGLLHRTDYGPIEVLIADNGSEEAATHTLFATLARDPRVRVLPMPGPFNYARLNNRAVAEARGEVLLLLNNDTEVIDPGWLREMVSHAVRPEIGAVGCKLLYPNGCVQHGGVFLLGVETPSGVAGHHFVGAAGDAPGPFGQLALVRSVSAVTAACLAVRRGVFLEAGGLDEENLPVAFNDVDLCLRIRERGYRNLWTPFAVLRHWESASRGLDLEGENARRFRREADYMRRRWGPALDNDPFWNPNLSLADSMRTLAWPPRRTKPWQCAGP
ncbi:glycosyltransferase family 2 protein [Caldovatus aquaticus]|uniref:Glycosyltransferase family 2 protein n=1 Tax=Caldovatus aquaticus TaxID=2865671 RepID=A0ABS7EZ79_9PROT|nr:glycosyltransferase family 2 protein [Caldovatus aquaticus]MBW8268568.1 glycosyltransferase family 2 protein [Caldovatus aquaticus]